MYDNFSSDYDRFVSWPGRLNYEMPLIRRVIAEVGGTNGRPPRVLDAACGTGVHAIELARQGLAATGADYSAGMIDRARQNAREAGVGVDFFVVGFGELANRVVASEATFDTLLCLGNSLPHVTTREQLAAALRDFAACLRPGGAVLIQNRNFDAVLSRRERWMEPQSYHEGEQEWLFLRFYDYRADGLIDFNIVDLTRETGSPWSQKIMTTTLYPILQAELAGLLPQCGLSRPAWLGSMAEEPFEPAASGNLVLVAYKD